MSDIFNNDDIFWTDGEGNEEDLDNENYEQIKSDNNTKTEDNDFFEINNKLLSAEDSVYIGTNKQFDEVTNVNVKSFSNKPNKLSIRKYWAIEDKSNVNNFEELLPINEQAMRFPYKLDDFQKRSIIRLHNNQYLLVLAHTGSGKTTIAEYAISLTQQRKQRVIYTSPIKALSNQKLNDFSKTFDSVGIITGDKCLNRDAQCLIMTTEILRNILYRNDPVIHQVGIIIFDEVHYINDFERGAIWEECIILIPSHITIVMLSATVPNYMEFANWVGITKNREVFINLTSKRIIPLTHYMWFNDKEYLYMDANSRINKTAYTIMYQDMNSTTKKTLTNKKNFSNSQSYGSAEKTELNKLQKFIKHLEAIEGLPVIIFCFSRNKVENFAIKVNRLNSCTKEISTKANILFSNLLNNIPEEDRSIPQLKVLNSIILKGVGIHHSGMLPICKEIIEILFSKGLIKVLFATETFAIGVNMPTKTVLLTDIKKHNGRKVVLLKSIEYTQMAGRAGRRGIDKFGRVYILATKQEPPLSSDIYKLLSSTAPPLDSKFRLTINMILHVKVFKIINEQNLMGQSFMESFRASQMPLLKKRKSKLRQTINELENKKTSEFNLIRAKDYCEIELEYRTTFYKLLVALAKNKIGSSIFGRYRVCEVYSDSDFNRAFFGLILEYVNTDNLTVLLLLPENCTKDKCLEIFAQSSNKHNKIIRDVLNDDSDYSENEFSIIETDSTECNYCILKKLTLKNIKALYDNILEFSDAVVCLNNNREDKNINKIQNFTTMETANYNNKYNYLLLKLTSLITNNLLVNINFEFVNNYISMDLAVELLAYKAISNKKQQSTFKVNELLLFNAEIEYKITKCKDQIEEIEQYLSQTSLKLLPDFKAKEQVLITHKYLNTNSTPTLKGRIACEILQRDEIALVEAYFNNVFNNLSESHCAAIISMFIYQFKELATSEVIPEDLNNIVDQIITFHNEFGSMIDANGGERDFEYWDTLCNKNFCMLAAQWVEGATFAQILEKSNIYEGTIVQALSRLINLTKILRNVAQSLNNKVLESKFTYILDKSCRGILMSESLYIKNAIKV